MFFVISGYLITTLILKDLERGSFSMANFWERRIRRIFPALAVMVAVTCVAGWFLLLPDDLAKLGASVIAQSLLVSNFYFWRTTNYFGGANEEKPLLHTWSLAVEEQFYLIFPIALMAIWSFFNYRLKKREEWNLTTIEHEGRCEKEQPQVGPKGERAGASESKCTEGQAGLRLGKPSGAAFLNPSTSELARDYANAAPTRSASVSASLQATSHPQPATALPCDATPATSPIGEQRRWTLFWIFAAVALLSFGLSIWGVKTQPFATFFLLPTRAWELLVGSMLAVLSATVVIRSAHLREILSMLGLAGIFLPVFFYGEQTPFPGLAALPACMGTAVLIFANTVPAGIINQGYFVRVISWGPIVFIGLISYSLYLWHWPIFAFGEYLSLIPNSSLGRLSVIGAVVLVSIISWNFVEKPFRKVMLDLNFKRVLSVAFCSNLIIILGAAFFIISDGGIQRFSGEARIAIENLRSSRGESMDFNNLTPSPNAAAIASGKFPQFGDLEKPGGLDLIIWGDSHAASLVHVFHKEFQRSGLRGGIVFNLSTPPLLGFDKALLLGLRPEKRIEINKQMLAYVQESGARNILLAGYWSQYQSIGGDSFVRKCLEETVNSLKATGATVWIATDWPDQSADPNRVLIFSQLPEFIPRPLARSYEEYKEANSAILEFLHESSCIRSLDLATPLLDVKTNKFDFIKNGNLIYKDRNHLTVPAICDYLSEQLLRVVVDLQANDKSL